MFGCMVRCLFVIYFIYPASINSSAPVEKNRLKPLINMMIKISLDRMVRNLNIGVSS